MVWKGSAECAHPPANGNAREPGYLVAARERRPRGRSTRTTQPHVWRGPRQAECVIRPKNNMSVYKSTCPRDSLFRGCCRGVLTHCLHSVGDRRNLGTNDGLNHLSALRDERSKTPWMWQGGMMAGAGMAAVAHLVKHERGA